jgi:hypothetical protein
VAKPIQLTERDFEVLRALSVHRMLSGDQLQRLVFRCSASRVRRRLRALYDHGLIDRVSIAVQPTAGVPPLVYILGAAGAAVLAERGLAADSTAGNPPGLAYIRHRYLVNDFYINLVMAVRGTPYRVVGWRHEQQLKLPGPDGRGVVEQVEHPLLPERMSFLPDAYFQLQISPKTSLAYFLEVDCATHSQRTWQQRALLYTAYADPAGGLFRSRFGRRTFRLLIVTTPDYRRRSRCDNILATVRQTVGDTDLFLGAPVDEVTAERMFDTIWRRPGTDERVAILSNSGAAGPIRVRSTNTSRPAIRVSGSAAADPNNGRG